MKRFFLILSFALSTTVSKAQDNSSDKQAVQMLKEFYTAHNGIESTIKSAPPNVYVRKSDSLQKKYCTLELRKKAKKYSENGFDFLTDDHGIDFGSLKTMTIIKDSTSKNSYIVSYDILDNNSPNKPVKRHVVLYVRVLIEGEHYKIASVK